MSIFLKIGHIFKRTLSSKTLKVQEDISSFQQLIKKRPIRKKKPFEDQAEKLPGSFNILAFSTAEEYNLESLMQGLKGEGLYAPKRIENYSDCIHATALYKLESETREVFFFREGSLVMWNMSDLESCNLLAFIKKYQQDPYAADLVQHEVEQMTYKYHQVEKYLKHYTHCCNIFRDLSSAGNKEKLLLDKYTFSNAIALSVKLGIWEACLERYVDSIEDVTHDLKMGKRVRMTRDEALRKHGELFALRHGINLSSDLLDVPDFYWDREQLESLYSSICSYFSIAKRTKVMNEKINHCVELIELLSSHLSDKHHVRLEWMIIVLIMVEVAFEMIHYADRYLS